MFRHALIVFLAILGLLPRGTKAEELIKSFDAAIQVETSGSLDVTETITVHATGDKIRHGIYRDFPFPWAAADKGGFKIVTVERDGQQDGWSREAISGGTRIYLGIRSQTVPPGDHTYRIRYQTDTQVRFHDTYDNLVWNVTGNDWLFPITQATATVSLPNGAKPQDVAVYTGSVGSRGQDATGQIANAIASFAMKRSLSIGEGLTIDIKIPKGVISPTAHVQRSHFAWWDGRTAMGGGSVLAVALLTLFSFWFLYGKDPSQGSTPLRWTAPEGLSPGLIGYIQDNGFPDSGRTAFSASLVDLAANGYIKIKNTSDSAYIIRTKKPAPNDLPTDQSILLNHIVDTNSYTKISRDNREFTISLINKYKDRITSHNKDIFFSKNRYLMVYSVLFLVSSVFLSTILAQQNPSIALSIFLILPVACFIPALTFLLLILIKPLFKLNTYLFNKIVRFHIFCFAIASTIITLVLCTSGENPKTTTEQVLIVIFVPIAFFLVFLMGRTTKRGRALKDQIEGLRQYMTLSPTRRSSMSGLPTMSPAHFESLLPYAIVLGVEGPWLRAFEEWRETATNKRAAVYNPNWWTDASFSVGRRGFGGTLSHVISTSAGNNSSFGSGFSGSGGGGGGGGGW